MSEFKTNKISPRSGTTQTIGDSGDSVSTSGGSTINNAGTISTAGITGGTINNTTGDIFLRGEVDWKPGDIKTTSFTPSPNEGYFLNTTSGQITVTLPATPSVGDVIGIKDYANTFDTNKCILNPNGNKIQGSTSNFEITVEGSSIILIYVDSTRGWVITDASKSADITEGPTYIVATGGTITTCGNDKIHTFTGPGTFTVCSVGNPLGGPNNVDYLVVAGGGAGGISTGAGGGGAGGNRTNYPGGTAVPVSATAFPITVGSGGSGGSPSAASTIGSNSIFSTITSAGGGYGGWQNCTPEKNGKPGGSGGGARYNAGASGGSGNTPPVSPPQGNNGGAGSSIAYTGSGGGGAGAVGSVGSPTSGGNGGVGLANTISGSPVFSAGGGGGATCAPGAASSGGNGGGGNGGKGPGAGTQATSGSVNTGGGGGAGDYNGTAANSNGGSGIVIIRYKFQ